MAKRLTETTNGTETPVANGHGDVRAEPPLIVESEPDIAHSAARMIAALRHDPSAIRRLFESGEYPYKSPMRTKAYEAHMLELQRELLKAQRWIEKAGQRVVVLFEGRDAAGKGGTIKR